MLRVIQKQIQPVADNLPHLTVTQQFAHRFLHLPAFKKKHNTSNLVDLTEL